MERKDSHKILLKLPIELWQRIELARVQQMGLQHTNNIQKKDFMLDIIDKGLSSLVK